MIWFFAKWYINQQSINSFFITYGKPIRPSNWDNMACWTKNIMVWSDVYTKIFNQILAHQHQTLQLYMQEWLWIMFWGKKTGHASCIGRLLLKLSIIPLWSGYKLVKRFNHYQAGFSKMHTDSPKIPSLL